MKVKTLDKLQNLDHGLWQGMLVEDVKTKQPKVYRQWQEQPETICPPQGETLGDGRGAAASGGRQADEEAQAEGLVAVVLPEPLASVLRHVLRHDELGRPVEEPQRGRAVGSDRRRPRSGRQQVAAIAESTPAAS